MDLIPAITAYPRDYETLGTIQVESQDPSQGGETGWTGSEVQKP